MRPDPKRVQEAFDAAVSAIGVRFKYGTGSYPIDESFLGWIGLNVGVHPDFARINPNIGVHCVPAMKLLASVQGKRYRAGEYATFSVPLGEVCPQVLQFIVRNEGEITRETSRLTETIDQFGIPYMRSHATLEAVIAELSKSVASLGVAPRLYAICLSLKGDESRTQEFIKTHIESLKKRGLSAQIAEMEDLRLHLQRPKP